MNTESVAWHVRGREGEKSLTGAGLDIPYNFNRTPTLYKKIEVYINVVPSMYMFTSPRGNIGSDRPGRVVFFKQDTVNATFQLQPDLCRYGML